MTPEDIRRMRALAAGAATLHRSARELPYLTDAAINERAIELVYHLARAHELSMDLLELLTPLAARSDHA